MSAPFTPESLLGSILDDAEGHAILSRYLPRLLAEPWILPLRHMPIGDVASIFGGSVLDAEASRDLWVELAALGPRSQSVSPALGEEDVVAPRADFEPGSVRRASARALYPAEAERWSMFELQLQGPSHGNPFVDVDLAAVFSSDDVRVRVGGFYDGDGRYIVRFMPPSEGTWSFETESTTRSLDGVSGGFSAAAPERGNRGPVQVSAGHHFEYANGEPYQPFGTTAYAWTHQSEGLQDQTVKTLTGSVFTKIRMALFPKSYAFNEEAPERFPFQLDSNGALDRLRFDPSYFRNLELRIRQLQEIGIQADLILFHPYDRWGFSELGRAADERFVRYTVRRLAAFRNVWWSMANEYDLLRAKSVADWDRLATIVTQEDHAGHLVSIHNWFELYDHSRPWITHCSIQGNAVEKVSEWRTKWDKPIIMDECGYEGDLPYGWGNISGEELTRLHWDAAVRGAFAGHGETYLNPREELWWSKGGVLVGQSPDRIGFLLAVVRDSPTGRLDPLPSDWDLPWGGVAGSYNVGYFGPRRPRYRDIDRPPGTRYHVDVIDTWNMTIERLPEPFEGSTRVELPGRPYMAIRLVATE
jgi:hypothetical protein